MTEYLAAVSAALWLGIWTSLSPCPLAGNIAAISYIGRRVGSPRQVFLAGLLYTLGRTLVYLTLGIGIVAGLLSVPGLSMFLQRYMNQLLGPILLVVGMLLLGLIRVGVPGPGVGEKLQRRVDVLGVWGAGLLGVLFALAFCPISAAWFFGILIPLAVKLRSSLMLPGVYGLGTALPVIVFAGLIALGARSVGKAFHVMATVERWARRIAGVLLLLVGIFYVLRFLFGVL
jgi:cytochrome c biogenesis protein CcdA